MQITWLRICRGTFVEIFAKISERVVNQGLVALTLTKSVKPSDPMENVERSKRDEFGEPTIYIYILYVTVAKAGKQEGDRWKMLTRDNHGAQTFDTRQRHYAESVLSDF